MMVKKITLICCIFLLAIPAMAQDVLIKRNGDEMEVKVLNITAKKISYKLWGNFNQKVHTIRVLDVAAIRFENGSVMSYVGDSEYYKEECDEEEEHDIVEARPEKDSVEKQDVPPLETPKIMPEEKAREEEVETVEVVATEPKVEETITTVEVSTEPKIEETITTVEVSTEPKVEETITTVEQPTEEVAIKDSTRVEEESVEEEFSLMSYGEYEEEVAELEAETLAIDTTAIAQEMSEEEYEAMLIAEDARMDSIKRAELELMNGLAEQDSTIENRTEEEISEVEVALIEEVSEVEMGEEVIEKEVESEEIVEEEVEEVVEVNEEMVEEVEEINEEKVEEVEEVNEEEVEDLEETLAPKLSKQEEKDYIKIRKERDKQRRAALNIMGAMPEKLDPNRYENYYNRKIKTYETVGYVESIVAWGIFLGVNLSLASRGAITVKQFGNRMIWSTVGCVALYWAPWGILSHMYGNQLEMISTASIYEKEFKLGDMNLSSGINVMHDNLTQKNNLGVGLKIKF